MTSASHAAGMRLSLIRLMTPHALKPKLRCIESQHWMAAPQAVVLHPVVQHDRDSLAIRRSGSSGTPSIVT